jgi:predicted transport protein
MSDQRFVEKTESFLKEIRLRLPPPESFETIDNMKVTINEYREFAQPYSATWHDYVFNVFHILGFKTKIETKRIITLSCIGDSESRKAVIILINEHEGFHDIIPGLEWSTFLFFTMHYFQVEWGILTDGIEFRLIHRDHNFNKVFLHGNLDEIIIDNKFDDFYAFYNIMSLIRGNKTLSIVKKIKEAQPKITKKPVSISAKQSGSYDLEFHLKNKSNTIITMVELLRSKILEISDEIEERIHKAYIGYYVVNSICQVRPYVSYIKIWVNLVFHQINDPLGYCRDVRDIWRHGTGDTEIIVKNFEEINYVLDIIRKSYKHNRRKF